MIIPYHISQEVEFRHPETNLMIELPYYFEYYDSKTNELLGKVYKVFDEENPNSEFRPYTYWFIPEPECKLNITKAESTIGGYAKLYESICSQLV